MKEKISRYKWQLGAASVIFLLLLWGPTILAKLATSSFRYDIMIDPISSIPKKDVAMVFGAGLINEDEPTPYLRNRVQTAVRLYKAGKVKHLLMTGANTLKTYNEPAVMKALAVKSGVPTKDITLDYAGLNTYDSCYRAKVIFGVDNATLVTQGYHLPRAVTACQGLGIDSIGVAASRKSRDYAANYIIREWLSTDKIFLQMIFEPTPTALGKPEPIKL